MPYLVSDAHGRVTSIHRDDPGGNSEQVSAKDPRVRAFLGGDRADDFARLDLEFVRVIEDVIDALTARNIINITDLPETAQAKLFARRSFRERAGSNSLKLFQESEFGDVL